MSAVLLQQARIVRNYRLIDIRLVVRVQRYRKASIEWIASIRSEGSLFTEVLGVGFTTTLLLFTVTHVGGFASTAIVDYMLEDISSECRIIFLLGYKGLDNAVNIIDRLNTVLRPYD